MRRGGLVAVLLGAGAWAALARESPARVEVDLPPTVAPEPPAPPTLRCVPARAARIPRAAVDEAGAPSSAGSTGPSLAEPLALRVDVVDAESERIVPHSGWTVSIDPKRGEGYGDAGHSPYVVEAPSGWVCWEPVPSGVTIFRGARSLHAVHPLRREVETVLHVRDVDGSAAVEAVVDHLAIAGRSIPVERARREGGRFRISGVPWLRDEPVSVSVGIESRTSTWVASIPADPRDRLEGSVTLPSQGIASCGPAHHRCFAVCGCGCGRAKPPEVPLGTIEVRGVRRGGSPAAGTGVEAEKQDAPYAGRTYRARLDPSGRAVLCDVYAGEYRVSLREPGLLRAVATITVRGSETSPADLVEPRGGTLDVRVVDDRGIGLSFATLEVTQSTGMSWLDLSDDDVQRIDPFTSCAGTRTLEHVEPGEVRIVATWGSRSAEAKVRLEESGRDRVTIVLPAHGDDLPSTADDEGCDD